MQILILQVIAEEYYRVDEILFDSEYKSTRVIYSTPLMAEEDLKNGMRGRFTIKLSDSWPVSFFLKDCSVKFYLDFKFDIPLGYDIHLKVPIKLHRCKEEIIEIEEPLSKEEEEQHELKELIMNLMKDGVTRDIVDIRLSIGYEWGVDEIREICEELVEEGYLETIGEGLILKKYRLKKVPDKK
jgi:hypothetical protein